jgi:hypothetical protein
MTPRWIRIRFFDAYLLGCGPECGDLRRFLWDFRYLCWANPFLLCLVSLLEPEFPLS